ncbi:hydrolase [Pleomassaria siparia CBS 279.74]|uniref:Hydrolase n=1 Tax=Pleomassaria siparia CBS 279.74 TaxID=1314801 RepID=A0A6G1KKI9_9PLEO|nr:hydrolase [Pleomassaria siparia CBS 279.74]
MHGNPIYYIFLSAVLLASRSISCHNGEEILDYASVAAQNNQARSVHQGDRHTQRKVAIHNVRVFDGHKLQDPSTVIIEGAFIGRDDRDAEHIDGNGATLLPGLIDAHCHPSNLTHLQDLARFGVTTAFVMACYSSEMCKSLKNHSGLPDTLRSGDPASAPGSVHGTLTAMVDPTLLISNQSQVPSWMTRQLASNPDYIKIIAETPGLDQQTLDLLVDQSHQGGKKVVCHASALAAYSQAIMANVDHIHHAPLDTAITSDMVQTILYQHQVVTPTLTMMRAIAENEPETRNFQAAIDSVSMLINAGIPILAGTDANTQPSVPAMVPFGISMHDELENLVTSGLSNLEALQAATSLPAKYFGLHDGGVIALGKRADFFLVEGNPLEDIKATRNIKTVWLAGIEYAARSNGTVTGVER